MSYDLLPVLVEVTHLGLLGDHGVYQLLPLLERYWVLKNLVRCLVAPLGGNAIMLSRYGLRDTLLFTG